MSDPVLDAIAAFHPREQRWLAHRTLFWRRHTEEPCDAHREIIEHIYASVPRLSIEGFRGLAKSTLLEEAAVLRACYGEFRFMLILSASYEMACARLAAIKNELETNQVLIRMFGQQQADPWRENRIVLKNGRCIQALGRDQSMTGIKYLDWRPDAALIDDVEDPEEVRTDAERAKTWTWFLRTFLPSLDDPVTSWVRMLATRRGAGSLPERVENDGWAVAKYPIEYIDEAGKRRPTWPGKFPLAKIDTLKRTYRGDMHTWEQEYMCRAVSETDRVFGRDIIRCEPRPRSWEAVYAMYDPARTTNRQSATTGKAVWSWKGNRLVFWEVKAEQWLPDRIVGDIFKTQDEYECTWIGFEEDGLNEWALQPIRAEMVKRRTMLPLLPVKAPRGKIQFVGGLQPYMKAGEVTFAGPSEAFSEAIDQFLSFPRGRIDAPNACAYALLLRPGGPVFEAFSDDNIAEALEPLSGSPLYLAANSDGSLVTAALVQHAQGEIRILADWVREGSPADVVIDIHQEASLAASSTVWRQHTDFGDGLKQPVTHNVLTRLPVRWIVPAWHNDMWRNVGLLQAIRAIPQECTAADGGADRGRAEIASLLGQRYLGIPRLQVSTTARWTLRAFSGGYARELGSRGVPAAQPDAGLYRLLMEGIESFAAVGLVDEAADDDLQQNYAVDRFGRRYKSAMPARR